ncbi:MAG: HEAT repeat domain-containing protein [Planctomycetota bacterium]|nr:HEAT repeat domain-containing protein [Planctomycetota bacterium]
MAHAALTRRAFVVLHGALLVGSTSAVGRSMPQDDGGKAAAPTLPEGFETRPVATEPLVQDPVAFSVEPDGSVLIAETERTNRGAMDNRSSPWHLEDDLQSLTVEDRLAYMRKWAHKRDGGMDFYSRYPDRVRRTVDSDGDGVFDRQTVFAGPFNDPLDGIGAGVMRVGDEVWYTNIPHLWRLIDGDGDGIAERREPIHSGFGVRFALYGHDMHGLVPGPDGRIYWSLGDRGYHVTTEDGRVLADPRSGAVFRCERDGSNLEVYATGLRNPQELAFNDLGDLFTGDNTSDAGDRARIVFVAQDGETGWTMDYQTLEGANLRGPWEQERIWEVVTADNEAFRPDWTLPPLAHVGAGPSGLAYATGLGLPSEYDDHFFMCDFTGSAPKSRIWTFQAVPDGAGYRVERPRIFAKGFLNTDVDFDWNGRMLVSEWGAGWGASKKGTLHEIVHPASLDDPRIEEAGRIARNGAGSMGSFELVDLLGHPDRRIRSMAQFELADRQATDLLADAARYGVDSRARIHAIWGLGEIARKEAARKRRIDGIMARVVPLLGDADAEVRAQAAKVLGDPAHPKATDALIERLADESSRVRYHAATSLGRIGDPTAAPYLVAMLAENADRDRFLRHAGVVALARLGETSILAEIAASPAPTLRRAAVLAMRRNGDPGLERLLYDVDPRIRAEAARAVHDLPIEEAMPALAMIADEFRPLSEGATEETLAVGREVFRIDRDHGRADLMSLEAFEGVPDETMVLPTFEGPSGDGDRYLSRLTTTLVVPQTGPYRFSIASDDSSILRLSRTGAAEDLEAIARVDGYVGPRRWSDLPSQTSEPIVLAEGQEILLEARHAEGGGGDHVAVAWLLPDGTFEGPIGAPVDLHPSAIPLLRRVVDANLRGGTPGDLDRLAGLVMNEALPLVIRDEAMQAVAAFDDPGPRDRVLGFWRPVEGGPRDLEEIRSVHGRMLPVLSNDAAPSIRTLARETAGRLGVALDPAQLRAIVFDTAAGDEDRASCLVQLARLGDPEVPRAIEVLLASASPRLRTAARRAMESTDLDGALASHLDALDRGTDPERQSSMLALGRIDRPAARARLAEELASVRDPAVDATPWSGEVLEAAASAGFEPETDDWRARSLVDPGSWDVALAGGDVEAGRRVARYHAGASCLRCHVIDGLGGDAGPSLDGIGATRTRESILQSIVDPHAVLVEGYGEASAMPNMRPILTPREVRDLVAYLMTLTETSAEGH